MTVIADDSNEACPAGLVSLAEKLADVGGEIALRYFRSPLDVDTKADESPVTRADREAEAAMRAILAEEVPDHGIVGEEHGVQGADSDYVWILDPIDGTKAFITGNPIFGTLVALTYRGRPLAGVISMPALNERWVGALGHPTRHRDPQGVTSTVQVRACDDLEQAILRCTSPQMFAASARDGAAFSRLAAKTRLTLFGGDCFCYAQLASGWVDLVVEGDLQPYDFMALLPVVEGAGGVVCDWQGQPLTLKSDGRVVCAGNTRLRDAALACLQQVA